MESDILWPTALSGAFTAVVGAFVWFVKWAVSYIRDNDSRALSMIMDERALDMERAERSEKQYAETITKQSQDNRKSIESLTVAIDHLSVTLKSEIDETPVWFTNHQNEILRQRIARTTVDPGPSTIHEG